VAGLIFKKSLVWHVAYSATLTLGFLGGVAMVTAIGLVTFTLYMVTSAAHLLSLPGMAVLSCALVLLARDELSDSWDAFIWQKLKIAAITSCIHGRFTYQSGWLIAEMDTPQKAAFMRFIARLTHSKKPTRVVRVLSDDGEVFIVGWDVRPMPMRADGRISHPNGQVFRFEKHLFD